MSGAFLQFDYSVYVTLAFLFGITAQFSAMDGHTFLRRMVASLENRIGIVYTIAVIALVFSPFILNDVVVLILTPVAVRYARQFQLDAAPLIVAEITVVNIASSLTPLGNPQNILLWSASGATIVQFVSGTWLTVLASGVIAFLVLLPLSMRAGGAREFPSTIGPFLPAVYLGLVAVVAVLSDIAGAAPYESLGVCFLLGFLFTFRALRQVVAEFDVRSLLTLYGLILVVTVVSTLATSTLVSYVQPVASGVQPYSATFVGISSNLISNVPATQLILNNVNISPLVAPKIAVEAGLAGNLTPVGSFANILALQMARRAGLPIRRTIALQLVVGLVTYLPAFL